MQFNSANNGIKGRLKRHLKAYKNHIEVKTATAYISIVNVLMLQYKNYDAKQCIAKSTNDKFSILTFYKTVSLFLIGCLKLEEFFNSQNFEMNCQYQQNHVKLEKKSCLKKGRFFE